MEAAVSAAVVAAVAMEVVAGGTGMMTAGVEVATGAVVAMEVVAVVAATTTAAGAVVTTRTAAVEIADMTIEGNYRGYRARLEVLCKLR